MKCNQAGECSVAQASSPATSNKLGLTGSSSPIKQQGTATNGAQLRPCQSELVKSLKGIPSSAQGNALGVKSFLNSSNPERVPHNIA